MVFRYARDDMRIQALWFGTVAVVQHTISVATHHVALAAAAARQHQGEQYRQHGEARAKGDERRVTTRTHPHAKG